MCVCACVHVWCVVSLLLLLFCGVRVCLCLLRERARQCGGIMHAALSLFFRSLQTYLKCDG